MKKRRIALSSNDDDDFNTVSRNHDNLQQSDPVFQFDQTLSPLVK